MVTQRARFLATVKLVVYLLILPFEVGARSLGLCPSWALNYSHQCKEIQLKICPHQFVVNSFQLDLALLKILYN